MEQLQNLRDFIQKMREDGDTDLRTILYMINKMIKDPDYRIELDEES